jgi:hypothetical protein
MNGTDTGIFAADADAAYALSEKIEAVKSAYDESVLSGQKASAIGQLDAYLADLGKYDEYGAQLVKTFVQTYKEMIMAAGNKADIDMLLSAAKQHIGNIDRGIPSSAIATPNVPTIQKTKTGKKRITVTWKKASASENITAYEISYRIKGKGKWRAREIAPNQARLVIKGLKKGKKYQVRIRALCDDGYDTIHSPWSKAKTSGRVK